MVDGGKRDVQVGSETGDRVSTEGEEEWGGPGMALGPEGSRGSGKAEEGSGVGKLEDVGEGDEEGVPAASGEPGAAEKPGGLVGGELDASEAEFFAELVAGEAEVGHAGGDGGGEGFS